MKTTRFAVLLLLLYPVWAAVGQQSDSLKISVQGGAPDQGAKEKAEQAAQPLTNDSIIKLVKAGLGEDMIIKMVDTQPGKYSLAADDIIALKNAGVSDRVISAILNKGSSSPTSGGRAATAETPGSALANVSSKQPEGISVKIPDGTAVEVELKSTISSEDLEEGSVVDFAVVQPVQVNGVTVVEKGAPAKTHVVEIKKARHWGRAGEITWAMTDAVGADGSLVPLRFTKQAKGGGSSGKVAAAVVATSLIVWPLAPVWGLHKGHPAVLPAGKRFEVFVDGDSVVKAKPSPSS